MAYVRKGITWIPEYTLKVVDEESAELTLRGTVVNEAEDLIHSDIHLVVGVPHFVHTEYMAPIAIGQVVRTIVATIAAATAPPQVASQMMNSAAITNYSNDGAMLVARPVEAASGDLTMLRSLPQMGGAAATDYTVYTRKDLTLRAARRPS